VLAAQLVRKVWSVRLVRKESKVTLVLQVRKAFKVFKA
jgi:hypothetical protein